MSITRGHDMAKVDRQDPQRLVLYWAAPSRVRALVTTRNGGCSAPPFGDAEGRANGLNLGAHVGDDPEHVRRNRESLQRSLPGQPCWLEQVHGVAVHEADRVPPPERPPVADAAVTTVPGQVLAVLTADCLPVLLADCHGRAVGIAHAGWRGLAAGVLEATVAAMRTRTDADSVLVAWLGPAIGPSAFEVGDEVRAAFCGGDPGAAEAFRPGPDPGKWFCDLYRLARRRLASVGVERVGGGGHCTVGDPQRFYSHRRDRRTGRMASLIWLDG
jgi:polyphenol oxidase